MNQSLAIREFVRSRNRPMKLREIADGMKPDIVFVSGRVSHMVKTGIMAKMEKAYIVVREAKRGKRVARQAPKVA